MKKINKLKIRERAGVTMTLLLLFISFTAFAQNGTVVTGTITDANNVPIPYANILEKGTTNGAVSDFDGVYSIEVSDVDTSELVFSLIGFKSQTKPVAGNASIDVVLQEDVANLDEVVVIGYGSQKRSDVTGAVASANIEAFENSPNTNIAQSLQGTVAGLNIGQVNSAGSTPEISIRGQVSLNGSQSVLIVLDGIQFNGSLSSLNPNDIESIDVLKDVSSTAVYGAQAANGVILITTKGGRRNQKAKISVSSSYATLQSTTDHRPLRRSDYIDHINMQLYDLRFLGPDYTTPNPDYVGYFEPGQGINANFELESDTNPGEFSDNDYDWWGNGTQTGFVQENEVSISGASETTSYLVSMGLTEQEGIINNDNFSRRSLRVNLDTNVSEGWKIGVQAFGSFEKLDGDEPHISQLRNFSPLLVPFDEDGNLIPNPAGTIEPNPFLGQNTQDYERKDYFFANVYSEVDLPFIEGLSYRINFGNNYRIEKRYGSSIYGAGLTGDAGKDIRFYRDYTLDNLLNYNRLFGKHDISATLLYGAIERKDERTNAYASGFDRLSLGYNDLSVGAIPIIGSSSFKETLNYQMLRANYKFDNRYIITGTIRRDGFSGFAANEKSAYFPSGALGWVASNESFLQNSDWVNNLKVRASYGIAGNQTGRYTSLARLGTKAAYVFGDGGSPAFGQELTTLANPNLRWEKTAGLNVGVDFSLFSSRLNGSIDTYKNITDDLLFSVRIPYLTGFSNIQTNVGKIQNTGLEVSLTGDIVRNDNFTWTAGLNYSRNKNEILELTGEDADGDGVEDDLIQSGLFIGESINAIYDYETDGIYQIGDDIPDGYGIGNYRIVDQNNDGLITQADDRKIIGTRDPSYAISLLNTFKYKNLSFSFFLNSIQGNDGNYISRNDNALYRNANTLYQNVVSGIDYWSPQNPDGLNAMAPNRPGIAGTRYEDRSFIRLQDVNLRYSFDNNVLESLGLDALSVFISGKNLATWTDWNGFDPEYQDSDRNIYGVGLTTGGRPVLKGYSLGVNLSF
ncbi:TonB-linked outer membrane protein, SusC/RagA family [Maribacter sedimenticola]|uniref:TonB-linked outer membrane protein, SusC/RagA family n=1 Tax=Maribacter sedimenticola TaxID=228956 RepID=A0ABY1SEG6_9FLAO|nr:TonB-dependent receptor [Maribacter sedimenticola]SNR31430.1 TonB-linked outer membrane protein, SusC/RagA family [Maribacter sedimenticola]